MLTLNKTKQTLSLDNGWWRVVHDLQRGGAISEVHFHKGTAGNFLARPMEVRNGDYSVLHEPSPRLSVRKSRGNIVVTISGRLTAENGKPGPEYQSVYRYSDACVRITQNISGAQSLVQSCGLAFGERCRWVEVGYSITNANPSKKWHEVHGSAIHEEMDEEPYTMGGYSEIGEGVQVTLPILHDWWKGTTRFVAATASDATTLILTHQARGDVSWEMTLAPTSFGRGQAYLYREAVICSQPFPTDEELVQLRELGVNLIRIHEGCNWKNTSDDFWSDGIFPPYPGPNLEEMKRVIATCHRLGMKIIPYFCFSEVDPFSESFLKHAWEWHCKQYPNHYVRWSYPGTDQMWGAPMCTVSGWGTWLAQYIERILKEYGFDGLYLDGCGTGSCFNPRHGTVPHTTFNTHQQILERFRRNMPDKLIVLHQVSFVFNVAQLNLGDHLVTFEEFGMSGPPTGEILPITMRVASACISAALVPGIFCPKDGTPLTPMLYYFCYKPGQEPTPTRKYLKSGIPIFLLNGNIPYTYYFNDALNWGYRTHRDRVEDEDGIYALYRRLREVGDTSGEFIPGFRSPFKSSNSQVGVAAIQQAKQTILVVANLQETAVPEVGVTGPGIDAAIRLSLAPFEYRFIPLKKDTNET